MCTASAPDGLRGIGSVGFGRFCCEGVAGHGSADCSSLRTVGYGVMMAGIGGGYAQVWVGLDAGSPGRGSLRRLMAHGLMAGASMVAMVCGRLVR